MKQLFFITTLSLSLTTMGCSNNGFEQIETQGTIIETAVIQQAKTISKDVDVEEFEKLISDTTGQVLDVRTPKEWASGTIKGANKINFFNKGFKDQLAKLDKTTPVYVYCKSGGRSGKAAKQMEKMGFTTIYNLVGGIAAWNAAGKEVVK